MQKTPFDEWRFAVQTLIKVDPKLTFQRGYGRFHLGKMNVGIA
jgi:hypothetical protein